MKSPNFFIFLLCLIMFSTGSAFALSESEIEQMLKYSSLYKSADRALNRVYKDAISNLKADKKDKVIANQKKWVSVGRSNAVNKLISQGYELDCAYAVATLEQACHIDYQFYTDTLTEAEMENGNIKTEEAYCEISIPHPLLNVIFYPEEVPTYCKKNE